MIKITPCVWHNTTALEAAQFYISIFGDGQILSNAGVMVEYQIFSQRFLHLNGGPMFAPNASFSLMTFCKTEKEIDHLWQNLSIGGQIMMPLTTYDWSPKYGWVQDKYGLNWQLNLDEKNESTAKFYPVMMFTQALAGKAEAAINHYCTIFPNSKIDFLARYTAEENDTTGYVKYGQFELNGQKFVAMDSSFAAMPSFTEGISLVVHCDSQAEIDQYWEQLTTQGQESMCGWLKDKYGFSWQIVPQILGKIMTDPVQSAIAIPRLMQMKKLIIADLLAP